MKSHLIAKCFVPALVACLLLLAGIAQAERPTAPRLLPESTLAYARVADSRVLIERFQQTSLGRIGQDEKIRPLVSQLYGSTAELFATLEDEVGLPLDKILALPQGEMCIALLAPPSGPPALVLMFEAGEKLPEVQKIIDKGLELAKREGATESSEMVGDVKFLTITTRNNDNFTYFEREGVLVVGTNVEELKKLLNAWNGELKEEDKTLADNRNFVTIMNRSMGTKDDPPQFTWFVDPIRLAKVAGRGNVTAQVGLAVLPAIGLDGLQGVGGSLNMATGEFDSVSHLHVLIDEPRTGALEAIAVTSGDVTPEPWVPVDASTYMTINFDVEKSYNSIIKVYNSFRGEGALENEVKTNINDRMEIDFEKDVLAACAGRFSYMTWIERPARLDSNGTLIGVQLKDPKAFQATFDKLTAKYGDNLEKTAYAGTPYWRVKAREPGVAVEERPDRVRLDFRPPQPCFAILGDYFIVTDRPACLEHSIVAMSESAKQLASDLEFKLIAGKIKRQPGGDQPGMISFNRPEEGMRMLYDLANAQNTRDVLENRSERNTFIKNFNQAMKDNPLPPFSVIARYLAPGGGFLVSDETGFHYASFQLRRK